jgi:galactokinase
MAFTEVKEKLFDFLEPCSGKETRFVSAPGRADFLNTHQDYKGLPVVPVAVRLRCYSAGFLNHTETVRFASLNFFARVLAFLSRVTSLSILSSKEEMSS